MNRKSSKKKRNLSKKKKANQSKKSNKSSQKWSIAIHGGCGGINRSRYVPPYVTFLHECCTTASKMLENGNEAVDVVEYVVSEMEDCELFNCGKGSVLNENGDVQMDSCIMDGRTLRSGGICSVPGVKNPIKLSKCLLTSFPPTFVLAGEGARKYAEENSLTICDKEYFVTGKRKKQQLRRKIVQRDHDNEEEDEEKIKITLKTHETVGCVCLDIHGDLAAGTSTGGLSNKLQGRVGDSGLVGTGTYANNETCAISCTGTGEKIIRSMIAYDIHARMKYQELSLYQSSKLVLEDLEYGVGGWIAIDLQGNVVMDYNTTGMFRCSMKSSENEPKVRVWEDQEEVEIKE